MRVRLRSLDGHKYRLFALNDPALDNSGDNDRGSTVGHSLVATDTDSGISSTLVSRPRETSTRTSCCGLSEEPATGSVEMTLPAGTSASGAVSLP